MTYKAECGGIKVKKRKIPKKKDLLLIAVFLFSCSFFYTVMGSFVFFVVLLFFAVSFSCSLFYFFSSREGKREKLKKILDGVKKSMWWFNFFSVMCIFLYILLITADTNIFVVSVFVASVAGTVLPLSGLISCCPEEDDE